MKLLKIIGLAAIAVLVTAAAAFAFDMPKIGAVLGMAALGGGLGMAMDGATAAPMQSAQRTVYPFRQNTRQKKTSLASSMTYSLGAQQSITLPKVGYLAKIYLRFNGAVTYSDTSVAAKFAPYSLFSRIRVDVNSGKQVLVDASGYQLFLLNSIRRKNARLDQNVDADHYAYPSSGSAQTIRVTLEIPIAVSDGNNFMNGLINLQAPELQTDVSVTFLSALTELGTNISSLSGTVDVLYEYYEIPDPTQVQQPYIGLHKILSGQEPLTGTGENRHVVPRGGRLLRMIHILECNGAKSDAYDKQEIWLNRSQQIYNVPRWQSKFNNRQMYGYALPTGTIVWDFMNAYDIAEESDQRDVFDTENITTLESIITVTSGTTLGSGNNFLHTLREIYQTPS